METLFLFVLLIIVLFFVVVVLIAAAGTGITRETQDIRRNPILYVLSIAAIVIMLLISHH